MIGVTVNKKLSIVILILILLLTACATAARSPSAAATTAVQAPSYPVQSQEYRIRAGDQLDIKFFYNAELNEQVIVRPDGRISLQLAHEVSVAGLTPSQLTDLLVKRYSKELDKPEITVIVRSFGGQRVYVDGEVNKPGMFNLNAPMTVVQSLAEAGGVKDTARTSEIVVIRRGVDNRPVTLVLNVDKVLDGTESNRDIYLMPSDIVYVPRSRIANVNVWVDQYIRKNIPVALGVTYNLNPTTTITR
jgi:polysaccharide export outer membrane protein